MKPKSAALARGASKPSVMARIDLVMAELNPLADVGRINFTDEDYARAPSRETVAAIEKLHGPLPPGLAEIYASVGSIKIVWEMPRVLPNGNSAPIRGAINVPPIEKMFGDWKDSLWIDSSPPDAIGRSLRPLDIFTAEWWAVMRPRDPLVYLIEAGIDDELRPTGLTVSEWFDRTLAARFYDGWLFCCTEGAHPDHAKNMADDLLPLFPQIDLSLFTPPSARSKKKAKK